MLRQLSIALAVLVVVMFFAKPASPWEFDEILFYQSIHHFDPIAHHPPPPGYPVFAATGHLLRPLFPSDFATLVTISFVASAIAFVLFALTFASIAGDVAAGIAGALLFYFSPAMLVHSTLPMSEAGAVCWLAAGLLTLYGRRSRVAGTMKRDEGPATGDLRPIGSVLAAATCLSLSIGWRPQFAVFILPLLVALLVQMKSWRDRAIFVGVFAIVCLAWLIPLAMSVGGFDRLLHFEANQAGYVAQHDADVSRSGWTASMIASRFIAHPWGTKLASFPLLVAAAIGAFRMRRNSRVVPIAIASIAYLVFALLFMDPADGVRYAIPFALGTALFAGVGAVWLARLAGAPSYSAVALFAAGSVVYVSSFLSQRSSTWSPPAYAAAIARTTLPETAVPLYELPLWPHAQYYFRDRAPMRVNDGLAKYFDRPEVPLFIYADGVSRARDAFVARWQPNDAYSKLTRNHYRVVSLIPVPPEQRFRIVRGVYMQEREIDGDAWRWLDTVAEIQLPHAGARTLSLRLGLPVIYPMEHNSIAISVNGAAPRVMALDRGKPVTISIPVPSGAPVVRFEAAKSFVPAELAGSLNRDPRRLAIKLYDLRTSS